MKFVFYTEAWSICEMCDQEMSEHVFVHLSGRNGLFTIMGGRVQPINCSRLFGESKTIIAMYRFQARYGN